MEKRTADGRNAEGALSGEHRPKIEVRAYFTLAPRVGHSGKVEVRPDDGRTLEEVAKAAGLDPTDVGLAMVNGCRESLDFIARPGDRVAFFPDYVPFHKVYGMCVL